MANYYSYFDDSTSGQNTRSEINSESSTFGMGVSEDINCGIITATSINRVQISVVDDKLTFTVAGVGSTTLTLS